MKTQVKKERITKNSKLDIVYIELTEMQRNIDESSKNLNNQRNTLIQIFKDIRKVLNIKHA